MRNHVAIINTIPQICGIVVHRNFQIIIDGVLTDAVISSNFKLTLIHKVKYVISQKNKTCSILIHHFHKKYSYNLTIYSKK